MKKNPDLAIETINAKTDKKEWRSCLATDRDCSEESNRTSKTPQEAIAEFSPTL